MKAEEPLKDFKLGSDMREVAFKNNYSGRSMEKNGLEEKKKKRRKN